MRTLVTSFMLFFLVGCDQGQEGDRCNPSLSHDECNTGLSCQQPPSCPENYCCPITGTSTDPNCQPGCNGGDIAICNATPDACVDGSND